MRYEHGLVIGKFLPPHRGHSLLIDTALDQSNRVTVIVCTKAEDPIAGDLRSGWIRELHPAAHVMVIDDRYDENDTSVWARNTLEWLGGPPSAVFSSEEYGEPYAKMMGCASVMVDRRRETVPCSGSMIRRDPYASWDFLGPPVRAWYAKRVCVLGAESTGTTTLARALASSLNTVWVAEYGRDYSAAKQARGETVWAAEEFAAIAKEQNRRENLLAREANRLVVGDTNSFATRLWQRRYLGYETEEVHAEGAKARCDLYLLTGDEIPFVQDGLRDGEHLRYTMQEWFEDALKSNGVPWRMIRGSPEERLVSAIEFICELFDQSTWKPVRLGSSLRAGDS